tara:strand:- start:46 stop:558 length:513 start_codon:yes stop_codon:yes gene_type:complete
MSFRNKTDLNPDIAVQNQQTSHLDIANKLLPNTAKDGTGTYYSPLLDNDGKLLVSNDTSHGTTVDTLIDNTSYATGSHQSNSADVRSSTGNMTLQGTITGSLVGQSVVIRGSHDNATFFELHNVNVNLVNESGTLHFVVNFDCAMSYIQVLYKNDDVISRTVNAKLSFKN